jgi:myo-inositol-1(or 4)-monophosphatase
LCLKETTKSKATTMSNVAIHPVLTEVKKISKEVGQFIHTECLSFDRNKIEAKGKFNNLVSYVDKEAEKKLVKVLSEILPGSGFITEEETISQEEKEWQWIIDPLDGTTNFMHGLPVYAVSIGLTYKGKPMLGVIYEPTRDECFYATKENGAFCNSTPIRVSQAANLSESLLATGFPYYHFEKMDAYLSIIKTFLDRTHGIRRLGSAAIDLAYVACGRLDGFFEYNLNPWDVAAGGFIVACAGGQVTDFSGEDNYLFGRQLCASNNVIQAEMLEIISEKWNA